MNRMNSSRRFGSKLVLLAATPTLLSLCGVARAQVFTWTGGGANDDWSTGLNWQGGAAPTSGAANLSLLFAGTTRVTPVQNIANPFILQNLTFDSTATSPYTIGGNQLRFSNLGASPTLVNNSTSTHTINNAIDFATTTTVNAASGFLTLSNTISGAGGLTKTGSSVLSLWGSNTYAGLTTVSAGALRLDHAGQNSTCIPGDITVDAAATLESWRSGQIADTSNVTINGGWAMNANAGIPREETFSTLSGSGTVNGGGIVLKPVGGTAEFSGTLSNLYFNIGDTSVGTQILSGNSSVGVSADFNAGTLQIGNGGSNGSFAGFIRVRSGAALVFNRSGTLTHANQIDGAGSVIKNGAGTVIFGTSNTYTGSTTINGGTLQLASATSANGPITINSGGALALATQDIWGNAFVTSTPAVTVNAGGTLQSSRFSTLVNLALNGGMVRLDAGLNAFYPSLALKGTVAVTGSQASEVLAGAGPFVAINIGTNVAGGSTTFNVNDVTGDASPDLVIAPVMQNNRDTGGNAVASGLTKTGSGTLRLTGNNTYTGGTTISGGVLQLSTTAPGTTNGGYSTPSFAIASGATLNIDVATGSTRNYDLITSAFSGAGTILKTGGGEVLWGASSATFAMDPGSLIDIQAGAMQAGSSGNEIWTNNKSHLNVASAGTFDAYAAAPRVDAITGSGTIEPGNNGAPEFYFLTIGVNNTSAGAYNAAGTALFSGVIRDHHFGGPAAVASIVKTGTGVQVLSGANTYTGTTTISGGVLQVGAGTTTGALSPSGVISNNANLTFNRSDTITQGTHFSGSAITGSGSLTKAGSGTLVFTAANTYTGVTTISDGTLQIGAGTTNGSVAGAITNNAALVFNPSGSFGYAGNISGSGSLTKSGGGSLTLSGTNTYSGSTAVSTGRLQFANRASLYNATPASWTASNLIVESGAVAAFNVGGAGEFTASDIDTLKALGTAGGGFKNGSILGLDTSNASGGNFVYGGVIADTNSGANVLGLQKLGNNTLTLTGNNTYTGTTTVTQGTLSLGGGTTSGSVAGTIVTNANLVFNRSDTISPSGLITGTGTVHMQGSGTLQLSGTPFSVGAFTHSAGTVEIAAGGASITVSNQVNINSPVTGGPLFASGGFFGSAGSGSVTVNGATLSFSTLDINAPFSAGAGPLVVSGGGFFQRTALLSTTGAATFNMTSNAAPRQPFSAGSAQMTGSGGAVFGNLGGTMTISNGGTITVPGGVILDAPITAGSLTVNGGYLTTTTSAGTITTTGGATFNMGTTVLVSSPINAGAGPLRFSGTSFSQGSGGTLSTTGAATIAMTGGVALSRPFSPASLYVSGSTFNNSGGTISTTGAATLAFTGVASFNASVSAASANISNSSGYIANGAVVTLSGGTWANSNDLFVGNGGTGRLNIGTGGRVSSTSGFIGNFGSSGTVTVNGGTWNSVALGVGNGGSGRLDIQTGGSVSSSSGAIGNGGTTSFGTVTVNGGTWANGGSLSVGFSGTGRLDIQTGGRVSDGNGVIGSQPGSSGTVTVNGGTWANSSALSVGFSGTGTLEIQSGGSVSSTAGTIAVDSGSSGTVTVGGTGALWANSATLTVGGAGSGRLFVNAGGRVTVGGTTSIGGSGSIIMGGGTLEFTSMSLTDYSSQITGSSGALIGSVGNYGGFTDVTTLPTVPSLPGLNTAGVVVTNSGVMYGNAILNHGLLNTTAGEVETSGSERMRFLGNGTNSGQITNFGAQIRFTGSAINQTTGIVQGRGQFIADGGWTNQGAMNFSGGFADVRGNVANTGSIITTGNGVTTFFNNLVHNGSEVRTAPGSVTAIFGLASGTGNFTGTGLVRFEGGYSPGNSPGHVNFAGDVLFGGTSNLELELGGLTRGTQYDAIDIAGAVTINSDIIVRRLNGFIPLPGQRFDVMTFGSMVGDPEVLNGTEFAGLWFDLARDADSLSLLPNALGGDATLDGIVNIGDFALLASRFNMTGQTWLGGDFTGDGVVNISDFAVLGANFNQTAPQQRMVPLAMPTSVPEPAVGALLLAAGLLGRRRGR